MNPEDRYTDIFDERPDASFERHLEQLAALYKANEPSTQPSWIQLQMHKENGVSSKQRRMALNWMHPKPRALPRLVLASGMLVFLLLLSGFAYAVFNLGLLDAIFTRNPASQQLLQAKQFTILQQRQIIDGYTFELDKGYADANRIIVGFIVTYPHGINPQTWDGPQIVSGVDVTELKTAGQTLSFLSAQRALDISNPKAGKEGVVMTFDGAAIQGNPGRIPLNLTLGSGCNLTGHECKHLLTYNFTLPFHPARVMNLHQTVTANGHALILEKVVVTPSETSAYIHWQQGDLEMPSWQGGPATYTQALYYLQLSAGGQVYPICSVGGGDACEPGFGPGGYLENNPSFINMGGVIGGPYRMGANPPRRFSFPSLSHFIISMAPGR